MASRGRGEQVVAERQAGGQRRGVRAARAVRGAVGVALARDLDVRSPSKSTSTASSRWPPVTTTARGPSAWTARARPSASSARRRPASTRASGRFGRHDRRPRRRRGPTSARCGVAVEQPRARLGDHHRVDDDRRARPEAGRAPRTPPRSSRPTPSIPIFTASTPMSSATARTCATIIAGETASTAVDGDGVLRRDRGDRGRAVHARARRTPSGRPGCRRRRRSPSRRSTGRRGCGAVRRTRRRRIGPGSRSPSRHHDVAAAGHAPQAARAARAR